MCCEDLQRVCCQTDEDVFLICWCFFYLQVFSEVAGHWRSLRKSCACSWLFNSAHNTHPGAWLFLEKSIKLYLSFINLIIFRDVWRMQYYSIGTQDLTWDWQKMCVMSSLMSWATININKISFTPAAIRFINEEVKWFCMVVFYFCVLCLFLVLLVGSNTNFNHGW